MPDSNPTSSSSAWASRPQVSVEKQLVTGRAHYSNLWPDPRRGASGRTESTGSVLLRQVLTSVHDQLGFGIVDDPVFRDLVIARIVEPRSKLDARRVLQDPGHVSKVILSRVSVRKSVAVVE